jgi:hypothetical protein
LENIQPIKKVRLLKELKFNHEQYKLVKRMVKSSLKKIVTILLFLLIIPGACSIFGQANDPVSGARVEVVGNNGYAVTDSEADGTFQISEGLGTGIYTVYVEEGGFISAEIEEVSIEADTQTDIGDIVLEPSGIVRGEVVDPEGNPVGGILVMIETSGGDAIEILNADSDGSFEFNTNLATGSYNIRAMPFSFQGFEMREVSLGFTTITLPFPQDRTVYKEGYAIGVEEDIDVTQGEVTDNVVVELGLSGAISGQITDTEGSPISGVVVTAFQPESGDEYQGFYAITDESGEYRIANNLATGSYNVTLLFPEGYVWNFNQAVHVEVNAGEEVENVNFELEPSGIISGIVVYSNDLPVPGAGVIATSEEGEYFGFTQTDIDGKFRIDSGLGTGDYSVFAAVEGSFAMPIQVQVEAGEETKDIRIVLQTTGPPKARIEGLVRDTNLNPISDATVNAHGSSTSTDNEGRYNLTLTLPTGDESLEVEVSASARGFEEDVKTVTVEAGSTQTVDFTLEGIPSGILTGRILGAGGIVEKVTPEVSLTVSDTIAQVGDSITISGSIEPFEGATEVIIEVTTPTDTEDESVTSTDGDFSYSLDVDSEGTWKVKARVPGGEIYEEAESDSVSITVSTPGDGDMDGRQCIIATVTFGSEVAPEVEFLRGFRQNMILSTETGSSFYIAFNAFYYSWSTSVARFIQANPILKPVFKVLIYPLLGILHLTTTLSTPLFSSTPEIASITAGFIASSLIGIVYIAPLLILAHLILKRKEINFSVDNQIIRMEAILIAATLTLTILGYATKTTILTTVSASAYVLSIIALSSSLILNTIQNKLQ